MKKDVHLVGGKREEVGYRWGIAWGIVWDLWRDGNERRGRGKGGGGRDICFKYRIVFKIDKYPS